MNQYGFFVDLSRCIGCNACVIACKQWHGISPGPIKWMRVYQWEEHAFPDTRIHILPIMCYHCERPVCIEACPENAIFKESKYGAVLVDASKCKGNRRCWKACPYGAPQYESDGFGVKMSKCNMCIDRLEKGLKPICILACSMRALEFAPLSELKKKYGELRRLKEMPKDTTKPAVVFKPTDSKKQVVPWSYERALELWKKRKTRDGEQLPDVFTDISSVTCVPERIVGRNKLVLKAGNTKELLYYTMDDE